jgi:conjugative transfer signal peptidase TraF
MWRPLSYLFLLMFIPLFFLWRNDLVINTTRSVPRGVYKIEDSPPENGDYVIFELPKNHPLRQLALERGYYSKNRKLQKRIKAMPGQEYSLSAPPAVDSRGRPIRSYEPANGITPAGHAMVLGQHLASFDSRFFGPVPLASMRVVSPIFIID